MFERQNLEAERDAAVANSKHSYRRAEEDERYAHLHKLEGLMWEMYAEEIQERIDAL